MNKKFTLKVYDPSEGIDGIGYLCIDANDNLLDTLRKYRGTVDAPSKLSEFMGVEFQCYLGEIEWRCGSFDREDLEEIAEEGVLEVDEFPDGKAVSVDCPTMVVDEHGVYLTATLKYTLVLIESELLTWKRLGL